MRLFSFFKKPQEDARKAIETYKREQLVKLGREQFKALIDRGLGIPVAAA